MTLGHGPWLTFSIIVLSVIGAFVAGVIVGWLGSNFLNLWIKEIFHR